MIFIGNIRQISNIYDENWLIVRSAKSVPKFSKQVIELSPSKELFYKYLNASKAGLYNDQWFMDNYVPKFLKEIKENKKALALLDELYNKSKTLNIMLSCFCPDETLCHRSIIAGLLLGAGANIDCNPDYIKYWHMFQSL